MLARMHRNWITHMLLRCWWNVNWYSHSGKQFGCVFQTKHATTTWPSNCTPPHSSQRNKNLLLHKNLYTNYYSNVTCNCQKLETTHMSFNSEWLCNCGIRVLQKTIQQSKGMKYWASLVVQWLRVCLLVQGTQVRALVWEDTTCHGAAGPVGHSCWACASGACAPQREGPQ